MSDLHHPDQSKASDAREEPKLPHPSTEDTKIGDTDATIVNLRDTIAELESNNAEKTKIVKILTAHVKENAQRNIDQIQKTRTATRTRTFEADVRIFQEFTCWMELFSL